MFRDFVINSLCTIPMMVVLACSITFMVSFKHKWVYILTFGVCTSLLRILMGAIGLDDISDIVQILLVPGLVILLSDDKFIRKVFASLLMYVIMVALEPLGNLFFTAMGGVIDETASSNLLAAPGPYILVRVVLLLLTCVLCYVVALVWNRTIKKAGSWNLLTFVLFPLSQLLLSWYATAMVTRAGGSAHDYLIISILLLVSIAADVVMVGAINRLRAADEVKRRTGYLEQQLMQQQSYYERVKSDAEDTSRVRHDLRNQIQTAYALMDEGNDASAREILDGLSDRISSAQYYCDDPVVNAVMNEKATVCRDLGIKLDSQLAVRSGTGIDGMDMCSLFANIMDNAINACRQSADAAPKISISAREKSGYLSLKCENTATEAAADTKRERSPLSEHGWGLEILSNLAEKYDGRLETEWSEGIFATKAFLKV